MLKQILKTWLPSIVRTTSGSCPYLRHDYRFYMLVFGGIAKSVKIIHCTEIHTPNLARDLEIFVRTYALRCCVHATITSRASLHCVIHKGILRSQLPPGCSSSFSFGAFSLPLLPVAGQGLEQFFLCTAILTHSRRPGPNRRH